jgi:hypothetical protein
MAHLTEAELIAYAAAKSAKVTPDKLKRWRAAKLLPLVERRGRGRASGIETLYPVEVGPWVVDLVEILSKDRSLKRAGWTLWLKGYPLNDHARAYMASYAKHADAMFYRMSRGEFDKTDPAIARIRAIPGIQSLINAGAGRPVLAADVAELNAYADKTSGGKAFPAKSEELPPRMQIWGNALSAASDQTLLQMRGEVLLLRFALEIALEREHVPPTPLLLLLWFGLTRLSPIGQAIWNALATGQMPQLLEKHRGDLEVIDSLIRIARNHLSHVTTAQYDHQGIDALDTRSIND